MESHVASTMDAMDSRHNMTAWDDQADAAKKDLGRKLRAALGPLPSAKIKLGDRSTPIRAMMAEIEQTFPDGWITCPHISPDSPGVWFGMIHSKVLTCQRMPCIQRGTQVLRQPTPLQDRQCDACGKLVDAPTDLTVMVHRWNFIQLTGFACADCVAKEPPGFMIGQ